MGFFAFLFFSFIFLVAALLALIKFGYGPQILALLKPMIVPKLTSTIESLAPGFLGGSPVKVGEIDFSLGSKCSVEVDHAIIGNVPDKGFKSDHLLQFSKVMVEVDVGKAVSEMIAAKSLPKDLEVLQVVVKAAHVLFEKSLMTSNVTELLEALKKTDDDDEKAEAAAEKPDSTDGKKEGMQVNVRHVEITDVQLELATTLGENIGVPGTVIALDSIKFQDFAKANGSVKMRKLVELLVGSILKSATVNTQNMVNAVTQGVKKAVTTTVGVVDDTVGLACDTVDQVTDAVGLGSAKDLVKGGVTGAVGQATQAADKVTDALAATQVKDQLTKDVKDLSKDLTKGVSKAGEDTVNALNDFTKGFGGLFGGKK